MAFSNCDVVQVAQLDSAAAAASSAGGEESTNMVDVAELMAAVLEDSPSTRLTMLQTSGMTCYRISAMPSSANATNIRCNFLQNNCNTEVSMLQTSGATSRRTSATP